MLVFMSFNISQIYNNSKPADRPVICLKSYLKIARLNLFRNRTMSAIELTG